MNWSKSKKIILIIVALGLVAGFVGYKIAYKPHKTIEEQAVAFSGTAENFKTEVAADSEKWQNAIIQLEATISDTDEGGVMMNETIYGQFKTGYSAPVKTGDNVVIKARFVGYDDLLEEIKLDNCIILNQ